MHRHQLATVNRSLSRTEAARLFAPCLVYPARNISNMRLAHPLATVFAALFACTGSCCMYRPFELFSWQREANHNWSLSELLSSMNKKMGQDCSWECVFMRSHYHDMDPNFYRQSRRFRCGEEQPWSSGVCAARVLDVAAEHLGSATPEGSNALLHAAFAFPCSWSDAAIDAALQAHLGAPAGGRLGLLARAAAQGSRWAQFFLGAQLVFGAEVQYVPCVFGGGGDLRAQLADMLPATRPGGANAGLALLEQARSQGVTLAAQLLAVHAALRGASDLELLDIMRGHNTWPFSVSAALAWALEPMSHCIPALGDDLSARWLLRAALEGDCYAIMDFGVHLGRDGESNGREFVDDWGARTGKAPPPPRTLSVDADGSVGPATSAGVGAGMQVPVALFDASPETVSDIFYAVVEECREALVCPWVTHGRSDGEGKPTPKQPRYMPRDATHSCSGSKCTRGVHPLLQSTPLRNCSRMVRRL
jgi:hypothetical protein